MLRLACASECNLFLDVLLKDILSRNISVLSILNHVWSKVVIVADYWSSKQARELLKRFPKSFKIRPQPSSAVADPSRRDGFLNNWTMQCVEGAHGNDLWRSLWHNHMLRSWGPSGFFEVRTKTNFEGVSDTSKCCGPEVQVISSKSERRQAAKLSLLLNL